MDQFVHIICNSSYWYNTDASWPLISKVEAVGCNLGAETRTQAKIDKFEFFLYDWYQIHYQIGFMGQFVHIICNSSYWYNTEASWPFISKVEAAGCNLGAQTRTQAKIDKFEFFSLWLIPNTLPDRLYGSFCLLYMSCIILVSHTALMIIYFKNRCSWVQYINI